MKGLDISSRILLAAMLPVAIVVLLLVGVLLVTRLGDSEQAHQQRVRSLAHQIAAASEYGVFTSNREQLQGIALAAVREPDLRSVTILNARRELMARAGIAGLAIPPTLGPYEQEYSDPGKALELLVQPIQASQIELQDLFFSRSAAPSAQAEVLGHVLLEVSSEKMMLRRTELLSLGAVLALGGLVLGWLLALELGRGVIQPVARVSEMVRRIGHGDLALRGEVQRDDPLYELQMGLNQMAQGLQVSRDELEKRIAEATLELREKKEIAEGATRAKSRFLAAASHDLRQPTHALGMFVTRLRQLELDLETQHLVSNLERAVESMRELLDSLLDVSRLEAGVVPVQIRAFAVTEIFDRLEAELGMTAVSKGLRLRIRPSEVWLLSDPALLHRILSNLLHNAFRYTVSGAVLLACRVSASGELAHIQVWDSGIGIAAEHQQDIFKEFFQVGNIERDRGKGLGLGLNIVQRTAHLLGCSLEVRSRPGVGSRFGIQVPTTSPVPQAATEEGSSSDSLSDFSGLQVLLVEDDALAREALSGLLGSWGAVVVEASSLADALQQLPLKADMIISDYRLGAGETGLSVVQQLRRTTQRDIPACLISGDTDPAILLSVRQAGMTLLHKPLRPAKLRSLMRRLLTKN